jgi:uncharacterized membrane protein
MRRLSKSRLEAFSDGVIAILITIMVLELKVPHGVDWAALHPLWSVFSTYALSFVFLGIYWNNHHHMLHVAGRINGKVLWANLPALYALAIPMAFVQRWVALAIYIFVALMWLVPDRRIEAHLER